MLHFLLQGSECLSECYFKYEWTWFYWYCILLISFPCVDKVIHFTNWSPFGIVLILIPKFIQLLDTHLQHTTPQFFCYTEGSPLEEVFGDVGFYCSPTRQTVPLGDSYLQYNIWVEWTMFMIGDIICWVVVQFKGSICFLNVHGFVCVVCLVSVCAAWFSFPYY